jgi:hypothetical protein
MPLFPSLFITKQNVVAAKMSCSGEKDQQEEEDVSRALPQELNHLYSENLNLRLYTGVNFKERGAFEGIYSFFPCKPAEAGLGFARPLIKLDNYITDHQIQGFKGTEISTKDTTKIWESVRLQVEEQGLRIGTYSELPGNVTCGGGALI